MLPFCSQSIFSIHHNGCIPVYTEWSFYTEGFKNVAFGIKVVDLLVKAYNVWAFSNNAPAIKEAYCQDVVNLGVDGGRGDPNCKLATVEGYPKIDDTWAGNAIKMYKYACEIGPDPLKPGTGFRKGLYWNQLNDDERGWFRDTYITSGPTSIPNELIYLLYLKAFESAY